jgi:hypothetical protein
VNTVAASTWYGNSGIPPPPEVLPAAVLVFSLTEFVVAVLEEEVDDCGS